MTIRDIFYPEGKSFEYREERMFARQDFVYNTTEDLLVELENRNISKQELASKLGKSRSFVTQLLSGSRNMTLGTLSDICFVLDIKPKLKLQSSSKTEDWDVAPMNEFAKRMCNVHNLTARKISANQEEVFWKDVPVDLVEKKAVGCK